MLIKNVYFVLGLVVYKFENDLLLYSYNKNELTDCEESNKKKTKFIQESANYIIDSEENRGTLYESLYFIISLD